MVSLAVSCGGRGVGMGSKVMEFCGSIVRALWHDLSPASWMLPIAATASARCSVHTLDDVLCLEYFCGPSRGRSAGFLPSCTAVSYFAMLFLAISTAGKTMTPQPTAAGTRDPLLQTALRLPLNKLMTRTTSPTTRSKWMRAPPMCKLKPNSHKTSKTTKIVQSMLASRPT
jgi:hypothetical protein